MRRDSLNKWRRRLNAAEEKEEISALDGLKRGKKRRRGRKLLFALLVVIALSCCAFYFVFDVSSWQ